MHFRGIKFEDEPKKEARLSIKEEKTEMEEMANDDAALEDDVKESIEDDTIENEPTIEEDGAEEEEAENRRRKRAAEEEEEVPLKRVKK